MKQTFTKEYMIANKGNLMNIKERIEKERKIRLREYINNKASQDECIGHMQGSVDMQSIAQKVIAERLEIVMNEAEATPSFDDGYGVFLAGFKQLIAELKSNS